jgi:hypothetical protein
VTIPRRSGSDGIAAVVTSVVEDVFATVGDVHADAVRVHRDVTARGGRLSGTDISGLGPSIRAHLQQRPGLIIGLGLIIAPDVLGDEPLRLEWWQNENGEGEPSALEVDLNRLSLGFYDYEAAEWFAVPRRSRSRHVVGPYVDVHGTGSYVLTFTMPMTVDGDFIGVAGADVSAAALESRLLEELAGTVPSVILNADDRVVFSTSPRWLAGSRVPPPTAAQELDLVDLPTLPWRLGTALPGNH